MQVIDLKMKNVEMSQWVKAPVAEPNDLCLILRTYYMLWREHSCTYVLTHIHTQTNKYKKCDEILNEIAKITYSENSKMMREYYEKFQAYVFDNLD